MRSFIFCAVASPGGFCQATCRRGARSSAGSADGATRACSRRSTTCWSWLIARGAAARRRPRPRCSTARASDHRERRPERLRRRQEGEGGKRQVMVDTDGRGLILEPSRPTSRTGTAPRVLRLSRRSFPFIAKAFADSGYAGERPRAPPALPSRSSGSRPTRSALRSIRADGWSSVSSPGSAVTDASGRTPKPLSPPPEPSSTQPPSCS